MSDHSSIEWTDATWNPVTGCTKVSPGCDHCYAETMHERFNGKGSFATVTLAPHRLEVPLSWRKPRRVFVNSMSDLFHDDIPDEYIAQVFAVMAACPQHTFQVLTKRHARMRSLLNRFVTDRLVSAVSWDMGQGFVDDSRWPLPNVHLGVSAEDQKWADIRIPALLNTPAAVRWISAEPLLGGIDLGEYLQPQCLCCDPAPGRPCVEEPALLSLDWVVVGGESGREARPMHPSWARSLRDQCVSTGVPFLFKQWGSWCPPHPDFGQSAFGYVTNENACQIVSQSGEFLGRPWPGWKVQDGSRDAHAMRRYAKGQAGRVLDGRTWDGYPEAA